jgi:hypothetical protein
MLVSAVAEKAKKENKKIKVFIIGSVLLMYVLLAPILTANLQSKLFLIYFLGAFPNPQKKKALILVSA